MVTAYFLVLSLFCAVQSAVLPVGKCKLDDSSCMVPAFQKAVPLFMVGLPEIGVEIMDTMDMEDIQFDLSGLQFSLKQGKLKGMKNTVINSVKWNLKKKKLEVVFNVNCTIKGHYIAGGRILILPITGDGQITLKLKNLEVKYTIDYEIEKDADGKDHVAPKKYGFEFEVKDNAHFAMTNLFNGNKDLSDTMHIFLNENWKQISAEFGRPIMGVTAKKVYLNIVTFFEKVPIGDIADVA